MEVSFPRQYIPLFHPHRNKLYYGGRGGAKSWSFAKAILKKGRQKKLRIFCLREFQNSIEESVHQLLIDTIHRYNLTDYKYNNKMIWNTVTGTKIKYAGMWRNVQNIKGLEGCDIAWIEEAQSVSQESLDILLPTIRKSGSEVWYSMNRFADNDPVFKTIAMNPDEETLVVKVNMMDLIPEFQSEILMKQMKKMKLEDYEKYLFIWEGEPMGQEPETVIPRADIVQAMENRFDARPLDPIMYGMDCARFGNDEITFYKTQGPKTIKYKIYKKLRTTQTERKWKEFVGTDKRCKQKIDLGNIGAGIYDHLFEEKYNVYGINFGGKKLLKRPDLYYDIASEMWFEFAKIIGQCDIPKDEKLKEELSLRKYVYKLREIDGVEYTVKMVEPKDTFKKALGKSPDRSDGIIQAYYEPLEETKETVEVEVAERESMTDGF